MANTINADNGVVSTVPGLKYSADTSGELILQTNTTNALTLDTTQGATFSTGALVTNPYAGSYSSGMVLDHTTSLGRISVAASSGIAFYNGGISARVETMRIDSTGKVGIGLIPTASLGALQVQSSSTNGLGLLVVGETNNERIQIRASQSAGGTAVYTALASRGSQASPSATLSGDALGYYQLGGYDGTAWQRSAWITGVATENYSATNRGSSLIFSTTPTGSTTIAERMRIDSSGNVGIGTSSPDSSNKLQVAGDIGVSWAANEFIGMKFDSGSSYKMGLMLNDTTRECKVWSQSSDSDDKITFYTGSTPSERMRITTAGNVGIGVAGPAYRLDVRTNSNSIDGILSRNDGQGSSAAAAVIVNGYGNSWVMACGSAAKNSNALTFELDASAPSERLRLNTGGTLILRGGSTTATGTGIAFPATQSASSDANTLDDYEEGSWTPTLTFNGGSTGITYSTRTGKYVKIGRFVQAQFRITLSNKGSSTGSAKVEGLPFPVRDEYGGACFGYVGAMNNSTAVNTQNQTPTLDINNSYVFLRYMNNGSSADHTEASFNNNTDIIMNVTYIGDV